MKKLIMIFLPAFCLGCASEHEKLVDEQIRSFEEAAEILEGIQDADSARTARPKLKQIVQRLYEQNQRARTLEISAEELRELAKKTQPVTKRLNEAALKAAAQPGCQEVVMEFRLDLSRLGAR